MKNKTIQQVAADYRKKHGNVTKEYEIRSNFAKTGLSASDVKKEIVRQGWLSEKRRQRFARPSTREFIKRMINKKLRIIADALPPQGYSMGSTYTAAIKGMDGYSSTINATSKYASSSKYKAKHGSVYLSILPKQLSKIKVIGGIITEVGEKIDKRLFKCRYLVAKGRKNNYKIEWLEGYLYRDYHFRSANNESAINYVKEYRSSLAEEIISNRRIEDIIKAANSIPITHVWVSFEDSIKSGNCRIGTELFARDKAINLNEVGAVRADYLLSIANGRTAYAEKAVQAARIRKAKSIIVNKQL